MEYDKCNKCKEPLFLKTDNLTRYNTHTFANGDEYVGEYKDGGRHGQGTYTYANGDKEVGEFIKNKFNGYKTKYKKN